MVYDTDCIETKENQCLTLGYIHNLNSSVRYAEVFYRFQWLIALVDCGQIINKTGKSNITILLASDSVK